MTERLEIGDLAPDFTLEQANGDPVTLSDLRGQKVVVYFYPAASTPGCTKQACDFRDNIASLSAHGYTVLGISPDTVEKLQKFAESEDLNFPLLSDPDKQVLQGWGAYGEKSMYGRVSVGVIRSTIVLDEEGKGALARYNVKATGHVAGLRKQLGIDS